MSLCCPSLLVFSLTRLERKMRHADNYADWKNAALEHDAKSGFEAWKSKEESKSYDYVNIRTRIDALKEFSCQSLTSCCHCRCVRSVFSSLCYVGIMMKFCL